MSGFKVKYHTGAIHHCGPEWSWTFKLMKDCDLWVVLDGEGILKVNNDCCKISLGSVVIMMPGCSVRGTHDPDNPLIVAAIHFDFIGCSPLQDYIYRNFNSSIFLGELIRHAIVAAGDKNQDEADFWLGAVLRKVLPSENYDISNPYAGKIMNLCAHIISHPEKSYKVTDMALELCLCKDHFSKVFKKLKGISPRDFVVRAKIEHARSLLLNSSLTIQEIADELRYCSVNFFCRQFKKQTSKSPQQFRKKS